MKHKTKIMMVILASLCSACDFSVKDLFPPTPFAENSGPLTSAEIESFASKMKESMGNEFAACISKEAAARALKLGDPETLDPTKVELLPVDEWGTLDKVGKRIILTQVVFNQASPLCIKPSSSPFVANSGPLTSDEIQYFTSKLKEPIGKQIVACISKEAAVRASKLGDPETLDSTAVGLSSDQWSKLDKSGKRLILTQVVIGQSTPICTQGKGK